MESEWEILWSSQFRFNFETAIAFWRESCCRSFFLSILYLWKGVDILTLAYSVCLRVGEVVKLESEDIDSDRKVIHIRESKGTKDRYSLPFKYIIKGFKRILLRNTNHQKGYLKAQEKVDVFPQRWFRRFAGRHEGKLA
ncbi:MAG TPA: tyrosine-type recombinase/integrase [Pseudothermotoga sp.]|nr:tyrosine-type recombinase/integrase [Pseudothermotoga sp.]HOK84102.1 tyrosine-type recombinase/integrase [Pseudothermotoga sp.]HPP69868.1 tyrosine-type recombinase/integrase [Pseudothermotoga sp.]